VFVHEAVLEALLCGETSVPSLELAQHYDDLITVDPQTHFAPIQEEFEVDLIWLLFTIINYRKNLR